MGRLSGRLRAEQYAQETGYEMGHHGDPQYVVSVRGYTDMPVAPYYIQLERGGEELGKNHWLVDPPKNRFEHAHDDVPDYEEVQGVFQKMRYPALTIADLRRRAQAANGGSDVTVAVLNEMKHDPIGEKPLRDFKSDVELNQWARGLIEGDIEKYLNDNDHWVQAEWDYDPSPCASEAVPSLEELMESLEQKGLEKYASQIKQVIAALPPPWPERATRRPRMKGQSPRPAPREVQYGARMLQKGEPYTDIDPQTGRETQKRYDPSPRGVLISDFLRKQMKGEADPARKRYLKELLDQAAKGESAAWSKQADEDGKSHWLSQQHEYAPPPRKTDPVEAFLEMELGHSPNRQAKLVIEDLLDKRRSQTGAGRPKRASALVLRCAAGLRERGYDALASRLEEKSAAIYRLGDSVRVKGLPEYIERSRAQMTNSKNLFDEMFDKYVRVFEGAAAILKKAKADMQDPSGIEEALREVVVPDRLMMQKLLEVGEIIKGGQS